MHDPIPPHTRTRAPLLTTPRLSKKELARAAQQRREEEIEGAKKHKEDVKRRMKERKRTQQRLTAKTTRSALRVCRGPVEGRLTVRRAKRRQAARRMKRHPISGFALCCRCALLTLPLASFALAGVAFCRGQPRLGNQIEHLLGRIKRDMDA